MAQYNFSPRNFTSVLSSTTKDLNNLANKLYLGNEIAKNQLNPTRSAASMERNRRNPITSAKKNPRLLTNFLVKQHNLFVFLAAGVQIRVSSI
jgi:hypothetical protein